MRQIGAIVRISILPSIIPGDSPLRLLLVNHSPSRKDPGPLATWLGAAAGRTVEGARVALVGCNRFGRDVARCLALTRACTSSRGRVVFIDCGDALMSSAGKRSWSAGGISTVVGRERVSGVSGGVFSSGICEVAQAVVESVFRSYCAYNSASCWSEGRTGRHTIVL